MLDNLLSFILQDYCPVFHPHPLCAFLDKIVLTFTKMAIAIEPLAMKPSALVPFHCTLSVWFNHVHVHHFETSFHLRFDFEKLKNLGFCRNFVRKMRFSPFFPLQLVIMGFKS